MIKFISTDTNTFTNINLIEKIRFGEDREGKFVEFQIKDGSYQKVQKENNDNLYEYLKSICIE